MLYYKTAGKKGDKPPLVLLHGLMETHEIWVDLIPLLEDTFQLIIPDLPGYGSSQIHQEINSMEYQAEEVYSLLSSLGYPKYHVVGHSMGGYVALALVEKYPKICESLCLFYSSFLADTEEKKNQRLKSIDVISENFEKYVSGGIPPLFGSSRRETPFMREKIEYAKDIALHSEPFTTIACLKGIMERKDRTFVLQNEDIQFVLIMGNQDEAIDSRDLIKVLPNKKPYISYYLLDSGHNGHLECPTICASIISHSLKLH